MPTKPIAVEQLLEHLPLFHGLRREQRAHLAEHTRQVRASKGETLFHRGDPATGMHVVVYGQIKLAFVGANGVEKVIDVRGPGQSFGEAVMFLEKPHVVTAVALADSLLLLVPREVIFERIDRDPGFARAIIGGLSRKLHELVADVEWLSTRSGTERVIGFLLRDCGAALEHAETDGVPTSVAIDLPVAKGVIASRLNLTQEHFSRILHDLAADGLISVQGRQITVRDLDRLRRYTQ
jgi:CRP-like cAMP-binding protein